MYDSEKLPFQTITDALLDMDHPFPPVYLHRFSDIPPHELKALKKIWADVPLARRQALMESLEDVVETDTLLNYHEIASFTLEDPDPQIRALAIRLLWEDEDKNLVPVFIHLLDTDSDVLVRSTAANALGFFVYQGEVEEIPEELLHTIEESLLKAATGAEEEIVRRRALESLGFSGRPEVPELIEKAYQNGSQDWLVSALFAMGRSADQRWNDSVIGMLDHPNDQVRMEATRSAGELQLDEARDQLLEMSRDEEDDDVRFAAIWSLSQIGGEGVRPLLEQLLEDTEDDDEADLIEDALENLSFTEDVPLFDILDYNPDEADFLDDEGNLIDKPENSAKNKKKKG